MNKAYSLLRTAVAVLLAIGLMGCGGGGNSSLDGLQGNQGNLQGPSAGQEQETSQPESMLHEVVMQPQETIDLSGRNISMAVPSGLHSQLPQVADSKTTLCAGSGWFLPGGAFQDELIQYNVGRDESEQNPGLFAPQYDGQDIATSALAIYRWNLRGYTGDQTVGISWNTDGAPAENQDFYIGFGNLQTDRWDFFNGPLDNVLTLDSFGPYRAANGDVLMVLLMLGTNPVNLAHLEAGVPETRSTGDIIELPETAPDIPLLASTTQLPASIDFSAQCAPVNDQMQWGACTAFAVGDSAYNHELGMVYGDLGWNLQQEQFRVSPKYLYIKSGELGGFPASGAYGRYTHEVIDNLDIYGVATEANAPYDMVYDNNWSMAAKDDATVLRIEDWREIPCNSIAGVETVKRIMVEQSKVIPFRLNLDSSFFSLLPNQVWYYSWGTVGGHAMCIVGYDDTKGINGAFKVRNSWGRYWGDKGHMWIGYENFLNPYAAIRCWSISEEYGQETVARFSLESPAVEPVTGLQASEGTEETGILLEWNEHPSAQQLRIHRDSIGNEIAQIDGSESSWLDESVSDAYGHVYWIEAGDGILSMPVTGYLASAPQISEILPLQGIEGEFIQLGASVTGSGPLSYFWDLSNLGIPSVLGSARPVISLNAPGDYPCSLKITNAIGSVEKNFTFKVTPAPALVLHVNETSGYAGDVIVPKIAVDGTLSQIDWNFGGGASPNETNESVPVVTLGDPGVYESSVTISNGVSEDVYFFNLVVLDQQDDVWDEPGHDGRRSRQSPVNGPVVNDVGWKFMASNPGKLNAHVYDVLELANGNLIVASYSGDSDSKLFCITPQGAVVWKEEYRWPNDGSLTQPLLSRDGQRLYVAISDNVYCHDVVDGSEVWHFDGVSKIGYELMLENEQRQVYLLKKGKLLMALDGMDGSVAMDEFLLSDGNNAVGPYVLSPDGTMFIATTFSNVDRLISFDTHENVPKHSLEVQYEIRGMAISADGLSLFMTDPRCDTRALNTSSCSVIWWQKETRGTFNWNRIAPVVKKDGTVVVANQDGLVSALDPSTGEVLWSHDLENEENCISIPAIGRDGTVYLGANDLHFYAITDSGLLWKSEANPSGSFRSSPSISSSGVVYCGDRSGMLWAFGPGGGSVFSPPEVLSVSPKTGESGESISISAVLEGSGSISYSWDFDGGAVPDTSTDASPIVTLGQPGTYDCTLIVENELGSFEFEFELEVLHSS